MVKNTTMQTSSGAQPSLEISLDLINTDGEGSWSLEWSDVENSWLMVTYISIHCHCYNSVSNNSWVLIIVTKLSNDVKFQEVISEITQHLSLSSVLINNCFFLFRYYVLYHLYFNIVRTLYVKPRNLIYHIYAFVAYRPILL